MIVFSCVSFHMSLTLGLKFSMLAVCILVCFILVKMASWFTIMGLIQSMFCICEKEILLQTFLEKLIALAYLEIGQNFGFCSLTLQCYQ